MWESSGGCSRTCSGCRGGPALVVQVVVGAAGPMVGCRRGPAVGAQGWQWGVRGVAPGRSCWICLPAVAPGGMLGNSFLFAFSSPCPAVKRSSLLTRAAAGSAGMKREVFSMRLSPGPSRLEVGRQKHLGILQFYVLFPHL